MVCIYCDGETKVVNSRHQKKTNQVWRRRKCSNCEAVFTSTEKVEVSQALVVQKENDYEPFSRDVLLFSIYYSLKHRKAAANDATALVATILNILITSTHEAAITRQDIVDTTYDVLSRFDNAAATHYKAFHK